MDEPDEVDEFTGYRLNDDARPLSRKAVWIRASVGLLTLVMFLISSKDWLLPIARDLERLLELFFSAF
jgi:hypothetical protein